MFNLSAVGHKESFSGTYFKYLVKFDIQELWNFSLRSCMRVWPRTLELGKNGITTETPKPQSGSKEVFLLHHGLIVKVREFQLPDVFPFLFDRKHFGGSSRHGDPLTPSRVNSLSL